jgi:outer membrane cobalamin receptor
MGNLNDLNLTAAWNFNDTFGVYAKLNNLLFQKQELWAGYPVQGFNAMAGININF